MRPTGHIFHVLSDNGQATVQVPDDLDDRHRAFVHGSVLQRIPQDQVRANQYGIPAIIKVVEGAWVYLTIVEKVRDASNRLAPAAHSMVLPLDGLMSMRAAPLPPLDGEGYRDLVTPSQVHAGGRRLADLRQEITRRVYGMDIPTTKAAAGWNTRELNWLLSNPHTEITDAAPEATVRDFLLGLHPRVSATLSFAVNYVPRGVGFDIACFANNIDSPRSGDVSTFRSGSRFRAAIKSTHITPILDRDGEHYLDLALKLARCPIIEALAEFRAGLSRGESSSASAARLIAVAVRGEDQKTALAGIEHAVDDVELMPEDDRDVILQAVETVARATRSPHSDLASRVLAAITLVAVPTAPTTVIAGPSTQDDKAAVPPSIVETDRTPPAVGKDDASLTGGRLEELDDVKEIVLRLRKRIDEDRTTEIGTVVSGVRRFTRLVIAGGPDVPHGKELGNLVRELWEEIYRWRDCKMAKRDDRSQRIALAFSARDERDTPSLFDDLIYVTRMVGTLKDHESTACAFDRLINSSIDRYRPKRRGFFR